MQHLDLTLPTPAENLALDEALLDGVAKSGPVLRIWESAIPAVILGRASRVAEEVHASACAEHSIPVLRRCSGGATVLISPGCLMYSVVIPTTDHPELAVIENAHQFVLSRIQLALTTLRIPVEAAGSSDLTWQGKKFSGNSLRCKRDALLYHGTVMYDADVERIERCLRMPPRQPDYRERRTHRDFLTNLPTNRGALSTALAKSWEADTNLQHWPREATQLLVDQRYALNSWNLQR